MCKECFHCMHGQCLELETNTVPCKLFGKSVLSIALIYENC